MTGRMILTQRLGRRGFDTKITINEPLVGSSGSYMATYEQNVKTLSRIQRHRDAQTPPDGWEEEQLKKEWEEMRREVEQIIWGEK